MRIKATDSKAAKIQAVFVNNKRVVMPVELDTEQGWVDVLVPELPLAIDSSPGDEKADGEFSYKTIRLRGEVKVIWNQ